MLQQIISFALVKTLELCTLLKICKITFTSLNFLDLSFQLHEKACEMQKPPMPFTIVSIGGYGLTFRDTRQEKKHSYTRDSLIHTGSLMLLLAVRTTAGENIRDRHIYISVAKLSITGVNARARAFHP